MKTPREILLAHHRAAAPKLDTIRHSTVTASRQSAAINAPKKLPSTTTIFQTLWQELFFPSRRFWTGTTVVWIFILIVNFSQRDNIDSVTGNTVRSNGPAMSLQAQQRWMNELFAERALPLDAKHPRQSTPKPHTQASPSAAV